MANRRRWWILGCVLLGVIGCAAVVLREPLKRKPPGGVLIVRDGDMSLYRVETLSGEQRARLARWGQRYSGTTRDSTIWGRGLELWGPLADVLIDERGQMEQVAREGRSDPLLDSEPGKMVVVVFEHPLTIDRLWSWLRRIIG